jgi:hypothetical protein
VCVCVCVCVCVFYGASTCPLCFRRCKHTYALTHKRYANMNIGAHLVRLASSHPRESTAKWLAARWEEERGNVKRGGGSAQRERGGEDEAAAGDKHAHAHALAQVGVKKDGREETEAAEEELPVTEQEFASRVLDKHTRQLFNAWQLEGDGVLAQRVLSRCGACVLVCNRGR